MSHHNLHIMHHHLTNVLLWRSCQSFSLHLHLLFFTWFFIIKGKLTVQVTSKDLVLLLQLSSSQWVYVGPTCEGQAVTALPPPPPGLCVPTSGALRDREGAGLLLVTFRLMRSGKGFPRLWSIMIWHGICHNWRITHDHRGTPLQARRSRRQCPGRQQRWWGMRGGNQREEARRHEWGRVGGGGKGGGITYVQVRLFSLPPLWKKTKRPLHLKSSHTQHFSAVAIIITVMIRSSLKDWQSIKRMHTCATQSFYIYTFTYLKGSVKWKGGWGLGKVTDIWALFSDCGLSFNFAVVFSSTKVYFAWKKL